MNLLPQTPKEKWNPCVRTIQLFLITILLTRYLLPSGFSSMWHLSLTAHLQRRDSLTWLAVVAAFISFPFNDVDWTFPHQLGAVQTPGYGLAIFHFTISDRRDLHGIWPRHPTVCGTPFVGRLPLARSNLVSTTAASLKTPGCGVNVWSFFWFILTLIRPMSLASHSVSILFHLDRRKGAASLAYRFLQIGCGDFASRRFFTWTTLTTLRTVSLCAFWFPNGYVRRL